MDRMTAEQIAAYKVDRFGWAPGEWDTEPDRIDFEHAGLPCLMLRHKRFGNWCGYAAVPATHPAFGKSYDDVDVEVHRGLTYAGDCTADICHVPKPGESDNVWWFGFDCARAWDVSPGMDARLRALDPKLPADLMETYCNAEYVHEEVRRLAEHLAAVTSPA